MSLEAIQSDLQQTRAHAHAHCVVCGASNEHGLRVAFEAIGDNEVKAAFDCRETLEGYAGLLHGGVIASLIDGAMTNCLFAHGVSAVTAELTVRFRHSVLTGTSATVRAWIQRSTPRLHLVQAEIAQDGRVMVTASGKFMRRVSLVDASASRA